MRLWSCFICVFFFIYFSWRTATNCNKKMIVFGVNVRGRHIYQLWAELFGILGSHWISMLPLNCFDFIFNNLLKDCISIWMCAAHASAYYILYCRPNSQIESSLVLAWHFQCLSHTNLFTPSIAETNCGSIKRKNSIKICIITTFLEVKWNINWRWIIINSFSIWNQLHYTCFYLKVNV